MNLFDTINVHAGGQGSGPTAPCPQCGPSGGKHKLEEGDFVKLKAPISVWNQKTGNNDTYPPGKVARIVNILPKVGDSPQMISVNVHKYHDPEYMKMEDVELHKPGSKEQVEDIKPVRKGMIIAKFKTADGADVTWVRSKEEKESDPKTMKQMSTDQHRLKGQFGLITSVPGKQDRPGYNRVTKLYDTSQMPAHLQKGAGAVVYVNTYSRKGAIKSVVIQEQNYTTYANKSRGLLSFSYKNAAQAVGMLKSRYGITQRLSRLTK